MSEIRADFRKLNNLLKALADKHQIQVGVFSDKDKARKDPGGKKPIGNAELGAIHEYGSPSRHIPPRSFLRMPLHVKGSEIARIVAPVVRTMLEEGRAVELKVKIGLAAEQVIDEAFATGGFGNWAPDKQRTVMAKTTKSMKAKIRRQGKKITGMPLIDTGALRRSIASRVVTA